jgi:hypothetical protein
MPAMKIGLPNCFQEGVMIDALRSPDQNTAAAAEFPLMQRNFITILTILLIGAGVWFAARNRPSRFAGGAATPEDATALQEIREKAEKAKKELTTRFGLAHQGAYFYEVLQSLVDARLIEKLRREELIPLGSRIRTRLATEHASRSELQACLAHLLAGAGNASLMTPQLQQTLCDHAAGNYRILTTLAAELLAAAAQRDLPQLDEKLYLDVFAQPESPAPRRAAAR